MTSNLGSEQITATHDSVTETGGAVTIPMLMDAIRRQLVAHFQPALLARFKTVVYRPLSAEALATIVRMNSTRSPGVSRAASACRSCATTRWRQNSLAPAR